MHRRVYLVLVMISVCSYTFLSAQSQYSTKRYTELLQSIARTQVVKSGFYYSGMFPSYRVYAAFPHPAKPDNNIFFTALIVYTLNSLKALLPDSCTTIIDTIAYRACLAYPHYQKSIHPLSYNFWPVDPPVVFPNSFLLKPFRYMNALPDDADDASIIWLSLHPTDSLVEAYHAYLRLYANRVHRRIRNTYRRYRDLPFYSTWFGKKMPVDIDFCVLCNILTLLYTYHVPFHQSDSASVFWLEQMIAQRKYLYDAAYISPHYARPPILLYHVARLWYNAHPEWLKPYVPQLCADIQQVMSKTHSFMDSVILSTALMRFGEKPGFPLSINDYLLDCDRHDPEFVFFEAGFYAMLRNPFKRWFTPLSFIKYYFYCPAYEKALLLEYMVIWNWLIASDA